MSAYRQMLQEALLRNARPKAAHYQRLYAVCAGLAYAAFMAAWLVAIIIHL